MGVKRVLDNVSSFIMDPSKDTRKSLAKGAAWVTTIFLGVGTLGFAHCLSALWRKLRHVDKNDTHRKIGELFHGVFSKKNTNQASVNDSSAPSTPPPVDSIPNISLHQQVAQDVYNKRVVLWQAAGREAKKNEEQLSVFIQKICGEYIKQNLSLSEVATDPAALNILFQSFRLRLALVNYAKVNKLQNILDKHLVYVAQNIYNEREKIFKQAVQAAKGNNLTDHKQIIIYSLLFIENLFKREDRSLREMFENREALDIFKKSNRLTLILTLYVKAQQPASEEGPSTDIKDDEFDRQRLKDAQKLGRQEGPGLVTRLGLNAFQSDEGKLKKGIRQILLKNHPDKNPNADLEIVKDGNVLLNMINHGVYAEYKAVHDACRKHP